MYNKMVLQFIEENKRREEDTMGENKPEKKNKNAIILLGIIIAVLIIFGIFKIVFSNVPNNISVSENDKNIEKLQNRVGELNEKINKLQQKMDPELEKLNNLYEEYTSIVGVYTTDSEVNATENVEADTEKAEE